MHDGKTDNANRVVSSLQDMIKPILDSSVESFTGSQEMCPEFFFMPEIYSNVNNQHVGITTESQTQSLVLSACPNNIDKFMLPNWALNHHDTVRVMRESLESKYVTQHLGTWIDLIFGCDHFNKEKLNEFFPWQYPEWYVDKSEMYKKWFTKWSKKGTKSEEEVQEIMDHLISVAQNNYYAPQ